MKTKKKHILAFELLEKEMETISIENQIDFKGGSGYDYYSSGGTITFGSLTATSVSQDMSLTQSGLLNAVGGYIQEGMGVNSLMMTTSGGIGLSQNANGEWVASASFNVTPPSNFTYPDAQGNVGIYINGELVSGFSVQDSRYASNGSIYTTGSIPTSGSMSMPSWYDGTQTVEFRVEMGASSRDAAGNLLGYLGRYGSASLTVPHY